VGWPKATVSSKTRLLEKKKMSLPAHGNLKRVEKKRLTMVNSTGAKFQKKKKKKQWGGGGFCKQPGLEENVKTKTCV